MLYARHFLTITVAACLLAALPAPLSAQQAPPAAGDEAALIAVIESDAPLFDKAKACQQLAVIGTKQAAAALAKLLPDEQLSHYARFGLEPIPDPTVDEALRTALGKLKGGLLVGVINSIGIRRDVKAIDDLRGLTGDSDPAVAAAAAAALGRIAAPQAIEILRAALAGPQSSRAAVADACLTAADQLMASDKKSEAASLYAALRQADLPEHLQLAALHGAIRAGGSDGLSLLTNCLRSEDKGVFRAGLRTAHEMNSPEVARMLIDVLDLPAEAQPSSTEPVARHPRRVLLIYALGDLGQPVAVPVILQAAQSSVPDIRQAAIRVLGDVGDASAVPVLLAAAVGESELSLAAMASLVKLEGPEVDAALGKALDGAAGNERLMLIKLAGDRGISSAVAALKQAADDADPQVAAAALRALGTTVGLDDLSTLIGRLVKPRSSEEAAVAKEALQKAVLRMPDRDATAAKLLGSMRQASTDTQIDLLDLLGIVGGEVALKGVAAAARGGSDEIQDAATRVLGGWLSPDAAPVLLDLAKTGNAKYRVRTLRGYIRIIRQFGLPDDERLAMCRQAMAVAARPQERELVLDALTRIPSPAAMEMVVACLGEAPLKKAASAAAVSIAEKLIDQHPDVVAAAMTKTLAVTADQELAGRAKALLRRAQRK